MNLYMSLYRRRALPSANPIIAQQFVVDEIGQWQNVELLHDFFGGIVVDGIEDITEYSVRKDEIEELLGRAELRLSKSASSLQTVAELRQIDTLGRVAKALAEVLMDSEAQDEFLYLERRQ